MSDFTVCVPINADGTIHERLGQANVIATCHVHDGEVTDWTEHVVGWDTTYGVDVLGVHHPRVIRFMRDHGVNLVITDDVCTAVHTTLESMGVSVQRDITGDARSAMLGLVPVG